MRVGVIIPVRNRPTLVIEALQGVVAQRRPADHIVVVDDGSTDDTASVVDNWAGGNDIREFTFLHQPAGGASAARNRGTAACKDCDLVAFLDSDDTWPECFLTRAVRALASSPQAVAASADRLRRNVRLDTTKLDDLRPLSRAPVAWMFRHGAGIGSCTLFRREAVVQAGLYPEHVPTGHDIMLFCRVAARGPWLHLSGPPAIFRHDHASTFGGMSHINEYYASNRSLRWALLYERIQRELGADSLSSRLRNRCLGPRWYRAGREALDAGKRRRAEHCFRRALRYRATTPRNWIGLLRSLQPGRLIGVSTAAQRNLTG